MSASVIQSGEYLLEIDTGWDSSSFTLDSSVKGLLDNTTYKLGPTTDFADVTDGVLDVSITRGRRDIGDQFVPGIMNFTLNDQLADGAFNPFNTDSPTYDPANNEPVCNKSANLFLSLFLYTIFNIDLLLCVQILIK
jgi:hypothetical protein